MIQLEPILGSIIVFCVLLVTSAAYKATAKYLLLRARHQRWQNESESIVIVAAAEKGLI